MYIDHEYFPETPEATNNISRLEELVDSLRHLILNEDFIEPNIIRELGPTLEDVSFPPLRLKFMYKLANAWDKSSAESAYERKEILEEIKIADSIKENSHISLNKGTFLTVSYTGPAPEASRKIVEIIAHKCKELLLRNRNQEIRETVRLVERQYRETAQRLEELEQQLLEMRIEQLWQTPENKISLLKQQQQAQDELRMLGSEVQILTEKKEDLRGKLTLLEQRLKLQDEDDDSTRKKLLINRLSGIEMQELALQRKVARLHTQIALHDEKIKALAAQEPEFRSLQLEIELYKNLWYEITKKREATRVKFELEKSYRHWFRIVDRSYPNKPIWGSPRDFVLVFWGLVLLFSILKFSISRLLRYFKNGSRQRRWS